MNLEEREKDLNELISLIKLRHEGKINEKDTISKLNRIRKRFKMDELKELPLSWKNLRGVHG